MSSVLRRVFKVCRLLAVSLAVASCQVVRPLPDVAVRVPDAKFRNYLSQNGYAVAVRGRYMVPADNANAVWRMCCNRQGIRSLQGIEMFPGLQTLICSDNPIEELCLGELHHLRFLYCLDVPLRRLDLSGCDSMRYIEFSHTDIRHLELAHTPCLDSLFCIFSPISQLDLRLVPELKTLYIRGTEITELDISPCSSFMTLHALDTPLRRLIVSSDQYWSDSLFVSVEDSVSVQVLP